MGQNRRTGLVTQPDGSGKIRPVRHDRLADQQ